MKNEKVTRDSIKQNEYKKALKLESLRLLGTEKCYASGKPYKGLIASHIKPYKICVLEGDKFSEFDINNGLLLSRDIDAYFDKLDITFDDEGKIICSDGIPDEIKEEFSNYQLNSIIYNDQRKKYMQIHRSLFYYKNYCQSDPSSYAYVKTMDDVTIPYYECGMKAFKNNIIVLKEGRWQIGNIYKFKHDFVSRTGHSFEKVLSSADLASVFLRTQEYILEKIPDGFNCKSCVVDLVNYQTAEQNSFKLCEAPVDPAKGKPERFMNLLKRIFASDESLPLAFQKVVNIALKGEGFSRNIVLFGNQNSTNLICDILNKVLGTYVYSLDNTNIMYHPEKAPSSIFNCRLLIAKLRGYAPEKTVIENTLSNQYFPYNDLIVDKYVPFYVLNNNKCSIENAVAFKCFGAVLDISVDELIEKEGPMILRWFLFAEESKNIEIPEECIGNVQTPSAILDKWAAECCIMTEDSRDKTPISELYACYAKYAEENHLGIMTLKMFSKEIENFFSKGRNAKGVYCRAVKIKNADNPALRGQSYSLSKALKMKGIMDDAKASFKVKPTNDKKMGDKKQENLISLNQWVSECCLLTENNADKTSVTALYENYVQFAKKNELFVMSLKEFGMDISEIFSKKRCADGMYCLAVKINNL